jgi:two-component system NtrC family sensor kinase
MDLNKAQCRRKILVVDDNPDIHGDFATILIPEESAENLEQLEAEIFGSAQRPSGPTHEYLLSFAFQGQQALEMVDAALAEDDPFHLAFVDMRMPPGWNGLETIERIWQSDPDIQVVLCTAYSDYSWEEIEQRLHRTDNLLILKKPFDVSEVAQMASTLTRKWILLKTAQLKQEELEKLVDERTQELQESNRQLEDEIKERRRLQKQLIRAQKMEAIGTLAAGVAHDLNNILAGIVSYPDLLLRQVEPQSLMFKQLQLIQKTGYKAAAIVQDMLTLGRRAVISHDEIDLQNVVNDFLVSPEWFKTQSHHSKVDIQTRFDSGFFCLEGSEVQLTKALMNLASNAAEAMPMGGTITIGLCRRKLENPLVGYESIPPGDYLVLSVADTGEGIDTMDLEHIFEPFYTKKKMGFSGTGLGLAVVWGTVRDHNGYIDVSSSKEKGTCFDLYFPDSGIECIAPPELEAAQAPAGTKKYKILVVDDVVEQREIAVEILKTLGYEAQAVGSGEAALEYLNQCSADLLLLDMMMDPGIDGLETYRRALALNPSQKAIVASGFSKTERVQEALTLGASHFLNKPYRLQHLAETVRSALGAIH